MAEKNPATAPAKVKAAKPSELDELNALAGAGKAHEDELRAKTAGGLSYIKILSDPQGAELQKNDTAFIKGAAYGHFVIGNKKITLGKVFQAVALGILKLYEETEVKQEGDESLPKVFGYWVPDDAEQIPTEGNFNRPFTARDGTQHVLRPVHWIPLFLPEYPEIEDAVLTFRSTANSISAKLAKALKGQTEIAPEVMITVKTQQIKNEKWKKTYLYPDFEIGEKNFNMVEGRLSLAKGGMDLATVKEVLIRYNHWQEEYAANRLVAKKSNIAGLLGSDAGKPAAAALGKPARGKGYTKAPDDDEPAF